jgi:hypothetical protein
MEQTITHDHALPPVLYLRSFKDDRESAYPGSTGLLNFLFALPTEEEQLAEELGPCLTLGRPDEKMPELGASESKSAVPSGRSGCKH